LCKANPACLWFTYFVKNQNCVAFTDCALAANSDVLSGQHECEEHSLVCGQQGLCRGYFVAAAVSPSATACLRFCQSVDECKWYSYLPEGTECILTSDCDLDSSCSDCVSGQRECDVAVHRSAH
jgi:hypothetical protein